MNEMGGGGFFSYGPRIEEIMKEFDDYKRRNEMSFEMKDGFGNLFKNKGKKTDAQPDYKGEIKIDGKIIKLAGWLKITQGGDKYLSLKVDTPMRQETKQDTDDFGDSVDF
jgi:hypothetical protein